MSDAAKGVLLYFGLVLATSAVLFLGVWMGYGGGYENGVHDTKRQAVEAGHAEYFIDEMTHEKRWRWLPEETK